LWSTGVGTATTKNVVAEVGDIGGDLQGRFLELGLRDLLVPIVAAPQLVDLLAIHVESDRAGKFPSEGQRHRQADISEPDHRNTFLHGRREYRVFTPYR